MYNIYNKVSDENNDKSLKLPYEIKDFKLPYTINIDTLMKLLKIKNDNSPPPKMYL